MFSKPNACATVLVRARCDVGSASTCSNAEGGPSGRSHVTCCLYMRKKTDRVGVAAGAFRDAMNDDLNVPKAVAALFTLRAEVLEGGVSGAGAEGALALLAEADAVLGVLELESAGGGGEEDAEIDALVEGRNAARTSKDWAEADRVRDELSAGGVVVEDSSDGGTSWFRK